ncbi:MAG: hypothetical protein LUH36_00860 [Oscillospiraceae bacterium]|nr:hypothetical protein [Oscillospiraceae bacterium]
MEWVRYVVAILSGLAAAIPLAAQLVKYVKAAVREKNWGSLLSLVMELMAEAESKFGTGAERKEWVLMMVKASADSINYDIDMDAIGEMIDALCDMSKEVNAPAADEGATA